MNKRKRKRLSQRLGITDGTPLSGIGKRRSSVSDAGLLSMSGSFLDCTLSPDKHESRGKHLSDSETTIEEKSTKKASMRYNHFTDFYHTESNYVGILDTILTVRFIYNIYFGIFIYIYRTKPTLYHYYTEK